MERTVTALLFLSLCVFAGCGDTSVYRASDERGEEGQDPTASSESTENEPRFWQDTDGAEAIELLGYDHGVVYRWQNGVVQASGYFNSEDGRERWKLDSAKLLPEQYGSQGASGVLVVVMSHAEDAILCEIVGKLHSGTASDGTFMEPTLQMQGKIEHGVKQIADDPALASFLQVSDIKDNSASLDTYVEGEWVEFFQIAFSPASKE